MLSCEFSKNTFSYGTPLVTAFEYTKNYLAKPEKTSESPNFPEPHPSELKSQPRILKIIIFWHGSSLLLQPAKPQAVLGLRWGEVI